MCETWEAYYHCGHTKQVTERCQEFRSRGRYEPGSCSTGVQQLSRWPVRGLCDPCEAAAQQRDNERRAQEEAARLRQEQLDREGYEKFVDRQSWEARQGPQSVYYENMRLQRLGYAPGAGTGGAAGGGYGGTGSASGSGGEWGYPGEVPSQFPWHDQNWQQRGQQQQRGGRGQQQRGGRGRGQSRSGVQQFPGQQQYPGQQPYPGQQDQQWPVQDESQLSPEERRQRLHDYWRARGWMEE